VSKIVRLKATKTTCGTYSMAVVLTPFLLVKIIFSFALLKFMQMLTPYYCLINIKILQNCQRQFDLLYKNFGQEKPQSLCKVWSEQNKYFYLLCAVYMLKSYVLGITLAKLIEKLYNLRVEELINLLKQAQLTHK
jgi:hypothetical protein